MSLTTEKGVEAYFTNWQGHPSVMRYHNILILPVTATLVFRPFLSLSSSVLLLRTDRPTGLLTHSLPQFVPPTDRPTDRTLQ